MNPMPPERSDVVLTGPTGIEPAGRDTLPEQGVPWAWGRLPLPAAAGPAVRIRLNAMLFSATALATSARGTVPNTSVLRMVRSNTMPTPASSVNAKRCHTCKRWSASPSAIANEMNTTTSWLNASA